MKDFQLNESTLSLALFTDVTNSKELLDSMQAGRLAPEGALLNALLIPDVFLVLASVNKALLAKSLESPTMSTLHSELVYNYSGSNNITESLKRCGISDDTTYSLADRFGASHDEHCSKKDIEKLIGGKEINLEELEGELTMHRSKRTIKYPHKNRQYLPLRVQSPAGLQLEMPWEDFSRIYILAGLSIICLWKLV